MPQAEGECVAVSQRYARGSPPPSLRDTLSPLERGERGFDVFRGFLRPSRHSYAPPRHSCAPPVISCAPPVIPAQAGIQATAQPSPRHRARDGLARHSPTRRRTLEAKHSHRSPGFLPAQRLPLT